MTATNHAVTGAVIAVLVSNPLIAIPTAFLAHFVMDAVPHFGLNIQDHNKRNSNKIFRYILIGDVILSGLLLILIPIVLTPAYNWFLVFGAMLACMSPDLVWGWHFYYELKTKKQRVKKWFSRFHAKIQWSETLPGGLVELAWYVGAVSLLVQIV